MSEREVIFSQLLESMVTPEKIEVQRYTPFVELEEESVEPVPEENPQPAAPQRPRKAQTSNTAEDEKKGNRGRKRRRRRGRGGKDKEGQKQGPSKGGQ